jgi:GT2 family glycosyltransferase
MKLAIVIPVSNHWELTRDCLIYLFERTEYQPEFIVIVDDGSTDETNESLRQARETYRGKIAVIRHPEQRGFAVACNHGMQMAQRMGATHVLLLNNDIEVWDAKWLGQIVDAFEGDADVVVGKDYVDYNSAALVDDEMVAYVGGWCMAFPVRLIEEIGLLDEELSPAFYEDVEFCARAQAAGYQLVGLGEGLGIHHLYGRTSLDGRLDVDSIHIANQPVFQEKVRRLRSRPSTLPRGGKTFGGGTTNTDAQGMRWAFYCPGNMVFDDSYLEGVGRGGAEGALVQLTRALAAQGAHVHVFNDCPRPGVFHGVEYHPLADFMLGRGRGWDAFVLFRVTPQPEVWERVDDVDAMDRVDGRTVRLFWSCDQYTTMDWPERVFPYVDRIVAISPFHRQFLIEHWGADPEKTVDLPLGVTPAEFEPILPKVRNRLIYCSVPLRGLQHLASIFPRVKERIPSASLVVTGDYTLWGSPEGYPDEPSRAVRDSLLGIPDVHLLGRVPRKRLIQEMMQAELHVYPCDYQAEIPYTGVKVDGENFCVASLECQAAGAPTIATPNGALRTTVEDGMSGYLVKGSLPGEALFEERFVNVVVDLLGEQRPALEQMQKYARRRALTRYSWEGIARRWARLIADSHTKAPRHEE